MKDYTKPELVEMYKSLCKRGRKKQRVMELMSEAIKTRRYSWTISIFSIKKPIQKCLQWI